MLYWSFVFLALALAAAVFGFGGLAVAFTEVARIMFFVFLVLFIVSLVARAWHSQGHPPVV